jgi:hypothetical protein
LHEISNDNGVRRRHSNVLDDRSFRAADCDTEHYLVVAKVRERVAVNKQRSHRKHAKLQWLQDLSQINGDNLNTVRYFRNKKRGYLKDKISELATNSKNKNIRDLYRGIN